MLKQLLSMLKLGISCQFYGMRKNQTQRILGLKLLKILNVVNNNNNTNKNNNDF